MLQSTKTLAEFEIVNNLKNHYINLAKGPYLHTILTAALTAIKHFICLFWFETYYSKFE